MSPARFADAPDFDDVVRATADHFSLSPELVVKDYWLTEVLRAIGADENLRGRVIFKGGTSLSKGWRLIERFSEDVDLLFTGPELGDAPTVESERVKLLKMVRPAIEKRLPLTLPVQSEVSRDVWNWRYFRDTWHCKIRYVLPGRDANPSAAVEGWILLEGGFRGGANPHAMRPIRSLISEFLDTQPAAREALSRYSEEFASFAMALLKPERTFAEKLLLLHTAFLGGDVAIERLKSRHYYDIARLFELSGDVRESLKSGQVKQLLREAAAISNKHFGTDFDIEKLDLSASPALKPGEKHLRTLRAQYDRERILYGPSAPTFAEILAAATEIARQLSE